MHQTMVQQQLIRCIQELWLEQNQQELLPHQKVKIKS